MVYLGYLIILFFVFSIAGWCIEVFLKYRQYGRFINRGFLIGPYCPIYGSGAVIITVLVEALSPVERSIGTTFLISFIGCGVLEYVVSYVMEKRFHTRWWDYSTKPMNLQGRIWIGNLVLFGLAGILIAEIIDPVFFSILQGISDIYIYIISALIVVVMLVDYGVSHFVMKFVKVSVENSEADSTEAISKEIKLLVTDKSILYKRIADAYPDAVYRTERVKARIEGVKAERARLEKEARENWELKKKEKSENWDLLKTNPLELSEEIIKKQSELIRCLADDTADKNEIIQLQNEINEKKSQYEARKSLSLVGLNKKQLG